MITPLEITEQIRRANAQAVANGLEGWEVEDDRIESTPVVAHEGSNLIGNEFPATPSPEPPIEVIVGRGDGRGGEGRVRRMGSSPGEAPGDRPREEGQGETGAERRRERIPSRTSLTVVGAGCFDYDMWYGNEISLSPTGGTQRYG
jgi:hypothetical protein